MRISVCEFLRLSTQQNWCYLRPGVWSNSKGLHATRIKDGHYRVQQEDGSHVVLTYFRGLPSNTVRAKLKPRYRNQRFR